MTKYFDDFTMNDDFTDGYWIRKFHAFCQDFCELYSQESVEGASNDAEEWDLVQGFIHSLVCSSQSARNEDLPTNAEKAASFERLPLSMGRMARFVLQNYSSLKNVAETLPVVTTVRKIPEQYLKDPANSEFINEIKDLQNEVWMLQGKTERLKSAIGKMKSIHQSLQFKEQSKQHLRNSLKNINGRLDRFPLGKELQKHIQQLRNCVTTQTQLETKVAEIKNRLLFLTECKEMRDKATKSQSLSDDLLDSFVGKAVDLTDQISLKLVPQLQALNKCDQSSESLSIIETAAENRDIRSSERNTEQPVHKKEQTKSILAEVLRCRLAYVLHQARGHHQGLNRVISDASIEPETLPAQDEDTLYLKKSYDEAKNQLTLWESELTTLKQTSSILAKQMENDSKGLAAGSSSIASIDELENRVTEVSQLLRQRKGNLAPQVASLKSKRQEAQALEEVAESTGIRTRTKEAKQRELASLRDEASQLRATIHALEQRHELLQQLSSDFNPEKIKQSVADLRTQLKKHELQRLSVDQRVSDERLQSWTQLSRLLKNLKALHTETTKSVNKSQLQIDSNSTVLMIE